MTDESYDAAVATCLHPALTEQTQRTFEAISAPENARLFTKDTAIKAFSQIKA